jgi:hypothetical protein
MLFCLVNLKFWFCFDQKQVLIRNNSLHYLTKKLFFKENAFPQTKFKIYLAMLGITMTGPLNHWVTIIYMYSILTTH